MCQLSLNEANVGSSRLSVHPEDPFFIWMEDDRNQKKKISHKPQHNMSLKVKSGSKGGLNGGARNKSRALWAMIVRLRTLIDIRTTWDNLSIYRGAREVDGRIVEIDKHRFVIVRL